MQNELKGPQPQRYNSVSAPWHNQHCSMLLGPMNYDMPRKTTWC